MPLLRSSYFSYLPEPNCSFPDPEKNTQAVLWALLVLKAEAWIIPFLQQAMIILSAECLLLKTYLPLTCHLKQFIQLYPKTQRIQEWDQVARSSHP